MTEKLPTSPGADNDKGDVVHVDDFQAVNELPLFQTGLETLATDGRTPSAVDRLDSMAHHPAMSGESAERAGSVQLGEAAQFILDKYMESADRFHSAKGRHYRELMIGLVKGQILRIVSPEEAHAIIALVSPDVVAQTSVDDISGNDKPLYNSPQDAAANDRNDRD